MKKITAKKEAKVIELFRQRLSVPRISAATGVSPYSIRVIQAKFNLRATQGGVGKRTGMSARTLTAIRKALSDSERKIAAEFGISRGWLANFRRRNWWGGDRRAKKAASTSSVGLLDLPADPVETFVEKHRQLAAPPAQPEVISAQEFVAKFFTFEPREGALIDDAVVRKAAGILLLLHNEFCGKPQNESAYYRQLCAGVAERLGVAQPEVGNEWVH